VLRATFVPHIELTSRYIATFVGILGTTISPYLFFWQAGQEVEEEDHGGGHGARGRGHGGDVGRLARTGWCVSRSCSRVSRSVRPVPPTRSPFPRRRCPTCWAVRRPSSGSTTSHSTAVRGAEQPAGEIRGRDLAQLRALRRCPARLLAGHVRRRRDDPGQGNQRWPRARGLHQRRGDPESGGGASGSRPTASATPTPTTWRPAALDSSSATAPLLSAGDDRRVLLPGAAPALAGADRRLPVHRRSG
jgi:hypothetical protein